MIVIVTGSRDWSEKAVLRRVLSVLHGNGQDGIELLVEGGARGADTMARDWARDNGVPHETVPADWDRYGRAAGAKRNIQMLERYPSALVVAFPLPQGRGTQHCVMAAKDRKHKVWVVKPSGDWSIITCTPKTS